MKIKKCPICGNKAKSRMGFVTLMKPEGWQVCCVKCCLQTAWYDEEVMAISHWNKRV